MELYNKGFDVFQKHYLMYAMIGVLVSSCMGAAASMLALHTGHGPWQMFQVGLLVAVCMGFNATILSDRKRKVVYNAFLISCALSLLIVIFHIINI